MASATLHMNPPQLKNESSERSPEFDELVLEHLEMLFAVALKLTRNVLDAQDLTQTTLLKAMRFHKRFEQGTYIKAWLLTILRNTFINDYRRKNRKPTFVELSGTESAPDISPDKEVTNVAPGKTFPQVIELLDDEVKNAIENLPDEFRTAVIMADIEDKSYKEIAEAMECPLGTVMSRLYRGRKLLRKQLGDYARAHRIAGMEAEEAS